MPKRGLHAPYLQDWVPPLDGLRTRVPLESFSPDVSRISARLAPSERNPPSKICLRLRHPQAKPIQCVTSKPLVMDLDGRNKQDVSGGTGGFTYGVGASPDGKQLLCGSKRDGVRQLFVMNLADRSERQRINLKPGRAAMWPHWQPVACSD